MLEYRDGNFSDIMPEDEAMGKLLEKLNAAEAKGAQVRSLHLGTRAELERIKQKKSLEEKVDKLQAELKELQAKQGPTSELEPTRDEIIQILRDHNLKNKGE